MARSWATAGTQDNPWGSVGAVGGSEKPDWRLNGERVDLDARDGAGWTPLHFAAKCADEVSADTVASPVGDLMAPQPAFLVARLVGAGADPNALNNDGATPLHVAAADGSPATICALLQNGGDPSIGDRKGMTPLHHLVTRSPDEDPGLRAFRALIESGADLDETDNLHWTPLHHASCNNDDEAAFASALLEAGAMPNRTDRSGRTPLHCAAEFTAAGPIIRALVDGGADPNAKDDRLRWTALHMVARSGSAEQAKLLIGANATLRARDGDSQTPLHVAVAAGNAEVARVLVEEGADPYHRSRDSDWSPIQEADEREADAAMAWALVGDPNRRDENGRTPLHEAAAGGLPNWVKALLEAGANPNERDMDGRTPLHEAVLSLSGKACAEALTVAGADPTIEDKDGDTPCQLSSRDSS